MLELFQYTKTEVCYKLNGFQAYRFSEGLTDFLVRFPGPDLDFSKDPCPRPTPAPRPTPIRISAS